MTAQSATFGGYPVVQPGVARSWPAVLGGEHPTALLVPHGLRLEHSLAGAAVQGPAPHREVAPVGRVDRSCAALGRAPRLHARRTTIPDAALVG
jgi:hypothetical protein